MKTGMYPARIGAWDAYWFYHQYGGLPWNFDAVVSAITAFTTTGQQPQPVRKSNSNRNRSCFFTLHPGRKNSKIEFWAEKTTFKPEHWKSVSLDDGLEEGKLVLESEEKMLSSMCIELSFRRTIFSQKSKDAYYCLQRSALGFHNNWFNTYSEPRTEFQSEYWEGRLVRDEVVDKEVVQYHKDSIYFREYCTCARKGDFDVMQLQWWRTHPQPPKLFESRDEIKLVR